MTDAGYISGIRRSLHRFAGRRDGVAAVEFAIILPFMLSLYVGGAELGDGLSVQFKATLAARTVADLTSQCGAASSSGQYCDTANGLAIDSTTMNQILGAASTVMTPYSTANMVVTVSELELTGGNGSATVIWSASNTGSGRAIGSSYTLPAAMQSLQSGTYLILGEVTYPYTPSLGYVLTGTINMYQNALFFPRNSSCVQYNNL
ncbi:MAG: TadE/TadG family type IV pilus assembly protein, partial [Xanthobacteraceae bacterium]